MTNGEVKVDAVPAASVAVPGEPVACERCGEVPETHTANHWCDNQSFAASVASRASSEPVAMVLVPMHMTDEMEAVTRDDSWQWEDLLAAAGAITEEQYDDIAAGRSAPAPVTTLIAPAAAAAAAEPSEDEQRKSFETRARKSGYSLLRDGDEYRHPPTQHAWQGWMMGAEATPDRERAASLVASEEKK